MVDIIVENKCTSRTRSYSANRRNVPLSHIKGCVIKMEKKQTKKNTKSTKHKIRNKYRIQLKLDQQKCRRQQENKYLNSDIYLWCSTVLLLTKKRNSQRPRKNSWTNFNGEWVCSAQPRRKWKKKNKKISENYRACDTNTTTKKLNAHIFVARIFIFTAQFEHETFFIYCTAHESSAHINSK